MKLAAVQYRPPKGRPDRARAELSRLAEVAARGADLVVLPEMATTGYVWPDADALRPHAEPADGPTFAALAPVARRHACWIVAGYPEADGDRLYNAALLIGPRGDLVASYRKVYLYELDRAWATPGEERLAIRAEPFGVLAPGICMDLNDDGFVAHLFDAGATVAAFCTNWVDEDEPIHGYWRWRLGGWPGWFVAADTWGEEGDTRFRGESAILAPGGVVVAAAPRRGNAVLRVDTEALDGR